MTNFSITKDAENNLSTLSGRLQYALKILGVSQAECARRIKVKPQVIQYLCASNAKKSNFTFEIAEALGISSTWLAHGEGPMKLEDDPEVCFIKSQKRVPLLDWKTIREWIKHVEVRKQISNNHQDWILTSSDTGESGYALKLYDKSMYPRFDQSTVVIINPDRSPANGEFTICHLEELNDTVLRQYEYEQDNNIILRPFNVALYKPLTLTKADEIWGVMVEARWQA